MSMTLLCRLAAIVVALLIALPFNNAADSLSVSVSLNASVSARILPNLVSFSIEVWDFMRWTSAYPSPTRPAWINLMRQLMHTPQQRGPRYRIGGNSADLSVYDIQPLPKVPSGPPLIYSINETDLQSWKQAITAIDSELVLDLNFRRGDNASWAVSYVQAIADVIGWDRIIALEVGNEVDLYNGNRIRPGNYSYEQYESEYLLYTAAIQQAVPSLPSRIFQGLVTIGFEWLAEHLDDYLAAAGSSLFSLSQHSYPIPSCEGQTVTVQEVLDDQYAEAPAAFLRKQRVVQKVRAAGAEFVIGEGSEAVCNGAGPMALNTFATALWAVHELFDVAKAGVRHWHFHSWGTETATFSVLVYGNPRAPDRFLVQPIYYGLLLFSMATANHSRLLHTSVDSTNPHVHAYAALSERDVLSVVLLHKDLNATGNTTAAITVPITSSPPPAASLIRLLAPSAQAEYELTLAGQTYDGSTDGLPLGQWVEETVDGVAVEEGAVYRIELAPLSAVLLRLNVPQQAAAAPSVLLQ